jgi:hypothetical protein
MRLCRCSLVTRKSHGLLFFAINCGVAFVITLLALRLLTKMFNFPLSQLLHVVWPLLAMEVLACVVTLVVFWRRRLR